MATIPQLILRIAPLQVQTRLLITPFLQIVEQSRIGIARQLLRELIYAVKQGDEIRLWAGNGHIPDRGVQFRKRVEKVFLRRIFHGPSLSAMLRMTNKLLRDPFGWFTGGVKVNLGIWSKLTNVVVALVVVAILLLIGECYLPVIQENERMQSQILKLQAQLKAEEQKSRQLQGEIEALQNDPKTVERLTREKLGYARPDETVIYFEGTNRAQ